MNKKLVKKHAVMMEYVIVAVLIAAAVIVAVMVFGRTTKEEFNVAATAMSDAKGAEDLQKNLKDTTQQNIDKANEHTQKMQNYDLQDNKQQQQ